MLPPGLRYWFTWDVKTSCIGKRFFHFSNIYHMLFLMHSFGKYPLQLNDSCELRSSLVRSFSHYCLKNIVLCPSSVHTFKNGTKCCCCSSSLPILFVVLPCLTSAAQQSKVFWEGQGQYHSCL